MKVFGLYIYFYLQSSKSKKTPVIRPLGDAIFIVDSVHSLHVRVHILYLVISSYLVRPEGGWRSDRCPAMQPGEEGSFCFPRWQRWRLLCQIQAKSRLRGTTLPTSLLLLSYWCKNQRCAFPKKVFKLTSTTFYTLRNWPLQIPLSTCSGPWKPGSRCRLSKAHN
jgi:hypothetical protein